jgi:hypothetical protein
VSARLSVLRDIYVSCMRASENHPEQWHHYRRLVREIDRRQFKKGVRNGTKRNR